jgi:hypothetical protein
MAHFDELGLDPSIFVVKWHVKGPALGSPRAVAQRFIFGVRFMTVFVEALPIETVLRVWDALLLEGDKARPHCIPAVCVRFGGETMAPAGSLSCIHRHLSTQPRLSPCSAGMARGQALP